MTTPTPRPRNAASREEVVAWAAAQVAKAPPLTQQQVANLQRLMRPRPEWSA